MAFLTTIFNNSDEDHWEKFKRVHKYLNGTSHLKVMLTVESLSLITSSVMVLENYFSAKLFYVEVLLFVIVYFAIIAFLLVILAFVFSICLS